MTREIKCLASQDILLVIIYAYGEREGKASDLEMVVQSSGLNSTLTTSTDKY